MCNINVMRFTRKEPNMRTWFESLQVSELLQVAAIVTVGQVDDAAMTTGVSHPGSVPQAVEVLLDRFRYAG